MASSRVARLADQEGAHVVEALSCPDSRKSHVPAQRSRHAQSKRLEVSLHVLQLAAAFAELNGGRCPVSIP